MDDPLFILITITSIAAIGFLVFVRIKNMERIAKQNKLNQERQNIKDDYEIQLINEEKKAKEQAKFTPPEDIHK